MNNAAPTALILGGTGRTGSLLAGKLARRGIAARTASRHGADVRFDWDAPATHADVLAGDVEKVTGRPPATFRGFAERNAGAWTLAAK